MSKADHAPAQGTVSFQIPSEGRVPAKPVPWKQGAQSVFSQCLTTARSIPPRARWAVLLAVAVLVIWRMAPERIYQAQTQPAGPAVAEKFSSEGAQESEAPDSNVEHAHYVSSEPDSALLPYDVIPNGSGSLK